MQMLIDHSAAERMDRAFKGGQRATAEQSSEWGKLQEQTRKQCEAFDARVAGKPSAAISDSYPRNVKVAGDVAEIRVEGVLTKKPDFWSWYLYGANTTYESIQQALALIAADQAVKRVLFYIDSPGGTVDGLFECLAAIEAFAKPMSARSCYACSAAYSIAALVGSIEATNEAAGFGSIGVAISYFFDKEHEIDLTSSNAPNKRPDPTTPEGQKIIVDGLDAIEEIFVDAIAQGRKTTPKDVTKNYGRGGTVLAREALRLGMIDSIAKPQTSVVVISAEPDDDEGDEGDEPEQDNEPEEASAKNKPSAGTPVAPQQVASAAIGGAAKAQKKMTKEELRAQHPELFSAVFEDGKTAGVKEGTETERKRVSDHLTLGTASGDPETSHKAIESGASVADKTATYLAASMRRNAVETRQTETNATGAVLDGAKTAPNGKTAEDEVATELLRLMGEEPAEKK